MNTKSFNIPASNPVKQSWALSCEHANLFGRTYNDRITGLVRGGF